MIKIKYLALIAMIAIMLGSAAVITRRFHAQTALLHPTAAPGPEVYTTAHTSILSVLEDYFGYRPMPTQPIAFTHKVHLANGLQCLNCHTGVDTGPDARLPSVQLCMTCHQVIATDKPEIKKVAGYLARGEEIPWQRVYGFTQESHVKFNHAPHIRAGVDCKTCHGDMTQQTVAVRAVKQNMGFCLDCHRTHNVSVDCTVCHY